MEIEAQIYAALREQETKILSQIEELPEYKKAMEAYEKRLLETTKFVNCITAGIMPCQMVMIENLIDRKAEEDDICESDSDDDSDDSDSDDEIDMENDALNPSENGTNIPFFCTRNEILKGLNKGCDDIRTFQAASKSKKRRTIEALTKVVENDFNDHFQTTENVYRDIESLAREKGVEFATSKEQLYIIYRHHFPTKKDFKNFTKTRQKLWKSLLIKYVSNLSSGFILSQLAIMLSLVHLKAINKVHNIAMRIQISEIYPST